MAMRERSSYKDNRLDGEVVRYRSNGKVKAKLYFNHGEPCGETIEYDELGNVKHNKPDDSAHQETSRFRKFLDNLVGGV
jgi:antitoxin component YwqK of YwqJK toxin-antitoxin module